MPFIVLDFARVTFKIMLVFKFSPKLKYHLP